MTDLGAFPVSASEAVVDEPIERLVALDAAAWDDVFARYFDKMRNFAYVRTGDFHAAEDIASEVFSSALGSIAGYRRTEAPFSAWLYRIARNRTVDYIRRNQRRPQTVSLENIDVAGTALEGLIDDHNDLLRGLQKLTAEQQELIVLRFFNDCSLIETAAAMRKNVGAIKALQARAIGSLRREISR